MAEIHLSATMNKLEDVDADALRDALSRALDAKAVKRMMIALAYADGVHVETLSSRYDVPRTTVYSWLGRFEHQSISEAIKDESRSELPSKLTASQRKCLFDELAGLPAELGYDASEWTHEHVQSHIKRTYDVTYSLGHVSCFESIRLLVRPLDSTKKAYFQLNPFLFCLFF